MVLPEVETGLGEAGGCDDGGEADAVGFLMASS